MLPSELVRPLVESSDESEPRGARRGLFAAPAPMMGALPLEDSVSEYEVKEEEEDENEMQARSEHKSSSTLAF